MVVGGKANKGVGRSAPVAAVIVTPEGSAESHPFGFSGFVRGSGSC